MNTSIKCEVKDCLYIFDGYCWKMLVKVDKKGSCLTFKRKVVKR